MVVAELLPSPDSEVRRSESLPLEVWEVPQDKQNLKLPGMNHEGRPVSVVSTPSERTETGCGTCFFCAGLMRHSPSARSSTQVSG